jgi:hypothetical protein
VDLLVANGENGFCSLFVGLGFQPWEVLYVVQAYVTQPFGTRLYKEILSATIVVVNAN